MTRFNESTVEQAALDWLREIGYRTGYGPVDTAVGEVREHPFDVVLWDRLKAALLRLNPEASTQLIADALGRVQRADSQDTVLENQRLHDLMVKGVPVETKASDGQTVTQLLRLIDFKIQKTTTGWHSTSSRSSRMAIIAARTCWCSLMGCRLA